MNRKFKYLSDRRPLGAWVKSSILGKFELEHNELQSYLYTEKALTPKIMNSLELKQIDPPVEIDLCELLEKLGLDRHPELAEEYLKPENKKYIAEDITNVLSETKYISNEVINNTIQKFINYLKDVK